MKKKPNKRAKKKYNRNYYFKQRLKKLERETGILGGSFFRNFNVLKKFKNLKSLFTKEGMIRRTGLKRIRFLMKFFRNSPASVFKKEWKDVFKGREMDVVHILNNFSRDQLMDIARTYEDYWIDYHKNKHNLSGSDLRDYLRQASEMGKKSWQSGKPVYKDGVLQMSKKTQLSKLQLALKLLLGL